MSNQAKGSPSKHHWALTYGVILLLVSWLPIISVIALTTLGVLSDPNPNPVGAGLLSFFGSILAFPLIIIGVVAESSQRLSQRRPLKPFERWLAFAFLGFILINLVGVIVLRWR